MFEILGATMVSSGGFANPADGWMPIIKVLSALLIVLGLMGFWAYLAKRYYPGLRGARYAGPSIRVLGTVYLGSKRSIAVIGVQNKRLVVGMTPSSMTLLTTLEEEEEGLSSKTEPKNESGILSFSKIFRNQVVDKTGEAV